MPFLKGSQACARRKPNLRPLSSLFSAASPACGFRQLRRRAHHPPTTTATARPSPPRSNSMLLAFTCRAGYRLPAMAIFLAANQKQQMAMRWSCGCSSFVCGGSSCGGEDARCSTRLFVCCSAWLHDATLMRKQRGQRSSSCSCYSTAGYIGTSSLARGF